MATPPYVLFSPSVHLLHPLHLLSEEIVAFKAFDPQTNPKGDTKSKIDGSVQLCVLSAAIIAESQLKKAILSVFRNPDDFPYLEYAKQTAKRDFSLSRAKEFASMFLVDVNKELPNELSELKTLGGLRNIIAHGHQFEHELVFEGPYYTVKESNEKQALLDELIKVVPSLERFKRSNMAFNLMFEERELAKWAVLLTCKVLTSVSSHYGGINEYEMDYVKKLEKTFHKM